MLAGTPRHERGLCPRCAADIPLDPQAAVSRRKPALRLHHSRRLRAAAATALIAWELAGTGTIALSVNSTPVLGTPGSPWFYRPARRARPRPTAAQCLTGEHPP